VIALINNWNNRRISILSICTKSLFTKNCVDRSLYKIFCITDDIKRRTRHCKNHLKLFFLIMNFIVLLFYLVPIQSQTTKCQQNVHDAAVGKIKVRLEAGLPGTAIFSGPGAVQVPYFLFLPVWSRSTMYIFACPGSFGAWKSRA